jgi:protein involved in sex pheromone biosynthesis
VKKGNAVLKIKKYHSLAIVMLASFALAACQNGESDVSQASSTSSTETQSSQNQTDQLSTEYYSSYIQDGTYQINGASGLVSGDTSQANLENLERGLYDLAQNIFATEDYSLKEGQVLSEDTVNEWLGAKSDDNPNGLNPAGALSETIDGFEPRYLNSIMEYDFVNANGDVAGISIGLAMNYADTFTSDSDSQEVEITADQRIEQGKAMAETIVSRIRENEAYANIPIHIAVFENAASGDLGGGTYTTDAVSSSGTSFGDWSSYTKDYVVYGVDDAPNEEDTVSFTRFRDQVSSFYPQLSGLSGVGYYEDNELKKINIIINSQFDGYSEVIAVAQQAIATANSVFKTNVEIQIQVVTADGVRALLSRPQDADTFDYVLVN